MIREYVKAEAYDIFSSFGWRMQLISGKFEIALARRQCLSEADTIRQKGRDR